MHWPKTDADHVMVTAAEMENFESQILSSGMPESALMEKVGQSMADWFIQHFELLEEGVIVLVGPGHNGGDGLVVARELHLAGVDVKIWCPLPITKTLTANHLAHANWLGIKRLQSLPNVAGNSLWIDAVFGLAQTRKLPNRIDILFKERQLKVPGRLVSLDIPSGICSDSGKPFSDGAAVASFTLTVGLFKQGLVQDFGMSNVGCLVRIDLGLPKDLLEESPTPLPLRVSSSDLKTIIWPELSLTANKYERGRLLVIAGSDKYLGAGWLAIQGALASGAGHIQAAVPKTLVNNLWKMAPEVVLASGFEQFSKDRSIKRFLAIQELDRVDSLLIGPGIGESGENWLTLAESLQDFGGLLVIDADALNRLSFSDEGWKWIKRRNAPTWITPHHVEFRRLFPNIKKSSLLDEAIEAAQLSGAGVLLKGAHSVIADRYGRAWQLGDTDPWVARAGLGDLLAGFVAGVGAVSMASETGLSTDFLAISAFMHAEAARRCKKGSSPSSIVDLLKTLTRSIQLRSLEYGHIGMT